MQLSCPTKCFHFADLAFNLQRSNWNAADQFSRLHWLLLSTWNILKSGHIFCGHFTRSPKLDSHFNCCLKHLAMDFSYTPSLILVNRRLASFFSVCEDIKPEWEMYRWRGAHLCSSEGTEAPSVVSMGLLSSSTTPAHSRDVFCCMTSGFLLNVMSTVHSFQVWLTIS